MPLRHPARALGGLTPLEKEAVGGRCDVQHGDCDERENCEFVELVAEPGFEVFRPGLALRAAIGGVRVLVR